ncbi:hypothetical protein EDC96DRAFT_593894 [Choanephora cucurbitarum]|nr:hypothetical protein EDC96DRAFT_593894 [Choanephora cucurbitarum]
MKIFRFFVFATAIFTCGLPAVLADYWALDMLCGYEVQFVLRRESKHGSQTILWNRERLQGQSELCSYNQIICVKDVLILKSNCQEVIFNLRVQYANRWSTNNKIVVKGIDSDIGYISKVYKFHPTFEIE